MIAPDGATIPDVTGLLNGGGSDSHPDGPTTFFRFWLLPPGISVAVFDENGRPACDMVESPLPEVGDVTLWMCSPATDPSLGWTTRYTVDGVVYAQQDKDPPPSTVVDDTSASTP